MLKYSGNYNKNIVFGLRLEKLSWTYGRKRRQKNTEWLHSHRIICSEALEKESRVRLAHEHDLLASNLLPNYRVVIHCLPESIHRQLCFCPVTAESDCCHHGFLKMRALYTDKSSWQPVLMSLITDNLPGSGF